MQTSSICVDSGFYNSNEKCPDSNSILIVGSTPVPSCQSNDDGTYKYSFCKKFQYNPTNNCSHFTNISNGECVQSEDDALKLDELKNVNAINVPYCESRKSDYGTITHRYNYCTSS